MSGHRCDDSPAQGGTAGGELIALRDVGYSYPLPGGGSGKALDNLSLTLSPGDLAEFLCRSG